MKFKDDDSVKVFTDKIVRTLEFDWGASRCSIARGREGSLNLFSDSSWKGMSRPMMGLRGFAPGGHTAFPYQWGRHRHAGSASFQELRRIVREERPDVVVEGKTERTFRQVEVPSEFQSAAQFTRGRPIFIWSSDNPGAIVNKGRTVPPVIDDNAFIVHADVGNIILRASRVIKVSKDPRLVLFADLDAPEAGLLKIFWTINGQSFQRGRIVAPLEKGRNVIFLPILLPKETECRLRFGLQNAVEPYYIRKIEIRETSGEDGLVNK